MGFEDEAEQSFGRPCRQTNGRSKRTYDLTSSIVPRGTSFHHSVEPEFPPIAFDRARLSKLQSANYEFNLVAPKQPAWVHGSEMIAPSAMADVLVKRLMDHDEKQQRFRAES
jgi:hypothetical protein